MEDVNKQRPNFFSLSELEFGPLKFSFFTALLVTDLICLVIYLMRLLCKLENLRSVEDKKDRNGSQAK